MTITPFSEVSQILHLGHEHLPLAGRFLLRFFHPLFCGLLENLHGFDGIGVGLDDILPHFPHKWADTVEKNGGPVARNRLLALLSSMWGWAKRKRELSLDNPTEGVERLTEQPRERYLLPAELHRLYALLVADTGQASEALLLLLLTGQRKGNICGLRWSEFDSRDAVLKIPKERMKSGKAHIVPLATPALEILEKRKKAAEKGEKFVFPAKGKREHLYDLRRPLERMLEAAEIEERVTPHDLRRTWATYCGETRNDPGPLLGHAPQGVTKKYYEQVPLAFKREVMNATVKHIIKTATLSEPGEALSSTSAASGEVVPFRLVR